MRAPLVVVTGFLGAGKTTLVNRLLARRAARNATGKLGVIVNELGAVGIDGALLGGDNARQVELPGGCVCCVLGDELDKTLLELVAVNPDLDAIVLETTGVAEPLAIAWALRREPVVEHIRLVAVVTVVDAANFLASRDISTAVAAQVAYADVLLVTKGDIVSNDELERVETTVKSLAPRALVRRGSTDEHVAWLEELLDDPDLSAADDHAVPQPNGQVTEHIHTADCRHLDSSVEQSAHGIDSVWVGVRECVDLEELEDQLAELPANYVRIKGIVRARADRDTPRWFVVHRVGPRVSSEPVDPPEFEEGRIVALGPSVNRAALARCVASAVG